MIPKYRVTTVTLALPLVFGCAQAAPMNTSSPSPATVPTPSRAISPARPGAPAIKTDRRRYLLNDSAGIARLTIPFTYRNDTGQPVYLPTCRGVQPPRLEKLVGDRWIVAYAPIVSFCQGVPLTVRPGDSFNYTMQILAGMPGTTYVPRFIVSEVPGTYRVLWEVFAAVDGDARKPVPVKDLLPLELRVSNPFELAR
jgi:hypothetical protein